MSSRSVLALLLAAGLLSAASAPAEPRRRQSPACAATDSSCINARWSEVTCFLPPGADASQPSSPRLCVSPGPTRLGSRYGASLELKF